MYIMENKLSILLKYVSFAIYPHYRKITKGPGGGGSSVVGHTLSMLKALVSIPHPHHTHTPKKRKKKIKITKGI